MNKLFIVLLAVCLVSVNALVKRDAPETATEQNYLDKMKIDFQKFSDLLQKQVKETFDSKNLQDSLKKIQDKIKELTGETESAAKAA